LVGVAISGRFACRSRRHRWWPWHRFRTHPVLPPGRRRRRNRRFVPAGPPNPAFLANQRSLPGAWWPVQLCPLFVDQYGFAVQYI